jgi:uncharacterized repeat protein (TIGR01451 family)
MPRCQILPALLAGLLATILPGMAQADLTIDKVEDADPVIAGTNLTYTITLTNIGPVPADNVSWSDTLPAGTTFVSLTEPGGWTCSAPEEGTGGVVSCSLASLGVGSAAFTLIVAVDPSAADGTVLSNTADATADAMAGASDTETTTVETLADLQVAKVDGTDPIAAGNAQSYTITLTNAGPSFAQLVSLEDDLPAGTTFSSLTAPDGWTCNTPSVGSAGLVSCSIDALGLTSEIFTLTVLFDVGLTPGTIVTNEATASSETPEGNQGDETGSASSTVGPPEADLSLLKSAAPDFVLQDSDLTFTITVVNSGPGDAANVLLNDPLPAGVTFQSLAEPSGWDCVTPAVGDIGDVTCTAVTLAPGNAVFTLVVHVDPSVPTGTLLLNSAVVSSPTPDPTPENGNATSFTTVGPQPQPAALAATKTVSGQSQPGGAIVYTLVLTNNGPGVQADNPGPELTDVLPPELVLVSASATSGTATATPATNTVTWNGTLAAGGGSVTITIQATIDPDAAPGSVITNQAALAFDTNADGFNDATGVSDDPAIPGSGNPTALVVTAAAVEVPVLDVLGFALLAALLAAIGSRKLREGRI